MSLDIEGPLLSVPAAKPGQKYYVAAPGMDNDDGFYTANYDDDAAYAEQLQQNPQSGKLKRNVGDLLFARGGGQKRPYEVSGYRPAYESCVDTWILIADNGNLIYVISDDESIRNAAQVDHILELNLVENFLKSSANAPNVASLEGGVAGAITRLRNVSSTFLDDFCLMSCKRLYH